MTSLLEKIDIVAATDASVVILGESGTGKEVVARAIHGASARAAGPFVAINCAALPETLLEAALFGHRRGAFTGATADRDGCFRAAHGGTLLLDEIGELPLKAQVKLLRVLQEGTIEPLGSDRPQTIDVRILCATHRDLKQMVAAGSLREDLYYRINVLELHVPALRHRREDLTLLVNHFYRTYGGDRQEIEMSPIAWALLCNHAFPGNVRELEHAVHHAVVLSRGKPIDIEHLPFDIRGRAEAAKAPARTVSRLADSMKAFERACLLAALEATDGVKFKAAQRLGISRKTLWEKLKAHQISAREDPAAPTPAAGSRSG
jgi:DNA-binding NtrC family response regulator